MNCDFAAVFNGKQQIQRPSGTTFRLGNEVVIYSKARLNTKGSVWLFYYLVWERGDQTPYFKNDIFPSIILPVQLATLPAKPLDKISQAFDG